MGLKLLPGPSHPTTARSAWKPAPGSQSANPPAPPPPAVPPQEALIRELTRAAEGAGQIRAGAERAHREVSSILTDPVGRNALNRLLITPETVRDHPELKRSFDAYITPDGRRARIDLEQADRVFSESAMDQVQTLRRRLREYLADFDGMNLRATIAGSNAESADVRAMTRADQFQSWFVVPIGVFLVLLVFLRSPLACVNLVATMILTYAFALGATHVVFVSILGAEGLDWKVPYFLFVLLVAVGVDYNVFLMDRVRAESERLGLRAGLVRAIGQTGGLISSAAAITACSFASFLTSPLSSLRQLGFALVVGITLDALLVRPLLVPCGHWLLNRRHRLQLPPSSRLPLALPEPTTGAAPNRLAGVSD
jgi:RND superfamily putative drug exporter